MKRKFRYFLAVVFTLGIAAGTDSFGQHIVQQKPAKATVENSLRQLSERLLVASKAKDEKALREILTDDYSQVTADGKIRTRTTRIADTLLLEDNTEVLSLDSFDVHLYENAAVATCLVRDKGVFKGQPLRPKDSVDRYVCKRRQSMEDRRDTP
jgi:hypothetical protein